MKQKIIPIVSVLIGLLAFFLTYKYQAARDKELQSKIQEVYEGATKVTVLAAAHDIPGGTVIKSDDIGRKKVFKSSVGERYIRPEEISMILGKKTLFAIDRLDPVLWSFIDGGAQAASGLAPIIKPGMRAISLSISGAQAVSSMVNPNDRIDVLGTFSLPSKNTPGEMEVATLTVLQDVTVLATGQTLAKNQMNSRSRGRSTYSTVTLEVTPREAEMLVFAQQMKGRLTVALRNPTDVSYESNLPVVDFEKLQNGLEEMNVYRQRHILRKRNVK